jgi:hypothetical protein
MRRKHDGEVSRLAGRDGSSDEIDSMIALVPNLPGDGNVLIVSSTGRLAAATLESGSSAATTKQRATSIRSSAPAPAWGPAPRQFQGPDS